MMRVNYLVVSVFAALVISAGLVISKDVTVLGQGNKKEIEIRGIYGNPNVFWKKDLKLNELGVNAIFVHGGSINEKMMELAKAEGLKVFAEFATLNGKKYIEEHPEAWPINEKGKKAQPASWFMGVCPTEPGFRQFRMKLLREMLQRLDLDGVWMDYLHWHAQFEEPEAILPETCFCDNCLTTFQAATGIEVPNGTTPERAEWILKNSQNEWLDWRCSVVAGWARDIKMIIKQIRPDALLGVYHCPWDDDDFNGARRKNLGLDYDMLKEIVDVFSPMVYHGRMGRSAEWVRDNIEWFCKRVKIKSSEFPKVWPIVQSYNDPHVISAKEFEKVLRDGVSAEATGVMMFTSYSVAEDEEKTKTMKRIYMEWKERK
ncbi:family 10 glycosylhydrolase, partial [candidate division KSB1 bacterium]